MDRWCFGTRLFFRLEKGTVVQCVAPDSVIRDIEQPDHIKKILVQSSTFWCTHAPLLCLLQHTTPPTTAFCNYRQIPLNTLTTLQRSRHSHLILISVTTYHRHPVHQENNNTSSDAINLDGASSQGPYPSDDRNSVGLLREIIEFLTWGNHVSRAGSDESHRDTDRK